MFKDVIDKIKREHPQCVKHSCFELFEHYAKEYDRELDLIIEVELRKFIKFTYEYDAKRVIAAGDYMTAYNQMLEEYLENNLKE